MDRQTDIERQVSGQTDRHRKAGEWTDRQTEKVR